MKSQFVAVGSVILCLAACSAPQGKKLASGSSGLAAVAEGPGGATAQPTPATKAANLTNGSPGEVVNIYKGGTVTVMRDAGHQDGYQWRLSEIPDPTVLKVVSQDFIPGATPEAKGQQKWVFQAVGPGDVDVKMWYGDLRTAPVNGEPTYNFITSVTEQSEPAHKSKKAKSKKA